MARMTPAALLAALALGAACQSPEPSAPRPSTAAVPSAAIAGAPALWVPNESALDWDDFLATLRWNGSLRLTVAVSPSALPGSLKGEFAKLTEEGRVEFALRLPQDPVLPLLERLPADEQGSPSRSADVAEQLALARQSYRDYFGRPPKGFVPAAGAVTPELFPLLRSMGLQWIAVGRYTAPLPALPPSPAPAAPVEIQPPPLEPLPGDQPAGTSSAPASAAAPPSPAPADGASPWASVGGVVLVPFEAVVRSTAAGANIDPAPTDGRPVVVDEASGLVSTGTLRALLAAPSGFLIWNRPRWTTAADAVALHSTAPASIETRPWTGDLTLWTSTSTQRGAWALLGAAARAIERFQNSGRAQVEELDQATAWMRQAESGRLFIELGGDAGPDVQQQAETRFREAVAAVYTTIGAPPPDALSGPLEAAARGPVEAGADRFLTVSENGLEATDLLGDARAPEGQSDPTPYDLLDFKLDWTDSDLTFTFRLGGANASAPSPMIDVYVDLNHRIGAGSTAMLPGRTGQIRAEDAWEYALVATPEKAALFRASPRRTGPELQTELTPSFATGRAELKVKVPRSQMRGNPLKWGFVVVTTALDASADKPWTPLPAPGGGTLLDILEPQPSSPAGEKLLTAIRPAEMRNAP